MSATISLLYLFYVPLQLVACLKKRLEELRIENANILENHDDLIQQVSEDSDVMGQILSLFCCLKLDQKVEI